MKIFINTVIIMTLTALSGFSQSLDEYFRIAAENNRGLQATYKEFEAALQKVAQVKSLPDPTLSLGYFISPVETRVGPQRARFSLNQMFPWFGTLSARGDAAALSAEARYQSFLDERNRLYYQVSAAYYPLFELNRWKLIEQDNINILESYKSIATTRFSNGTGPMVDVLRVDIMLNDAVTKLDILDKKEQPLLASFNALLNRNLNDSVILFDSMGLEMVVEDFRKDSLDNNPVLNSLDLKLQASEASETVARKQGLPQLGVGIDYVIVGERPDMDLADNGKNVVMPMVSVSIPIFRNKYRASVKEAQLMQQSYSLQKEEYINYLSSNYEVAWFEIQQQKELLQLYDRQISESNQILNLLYSAYSNSGNEFEEVLRVQQQLLQYEKMKATAQVQYNIAVARLNYLTARTY